MKGRIPTILGLGILVVGVVAGIFLTNSKQLFKLGASPSVSPKDLRISNISDASFTVSWTTDKETVGFIEWGKDPSNLAQVAEADDMSPTFTHWIKVNNLTSSNVYYFKIVSDTNEFDNSGISWKVKTGPTLSNKPSSEIISGRITTKSGSPLGNALVYVTVGGGNLLSTVTDDLGNWLITISESRTQTLDSYSQISETASLIEISVEGGPMGISIAQIYPSAAKPVPMIKIGQTYNFKGLTNSNGNTNVPNANIEFPSTSSTSSSLKL